MNNVSLIGRFTKDPDTRYTTGENQMAVTRFTIAVDRWGKDAGADFIGCVAFSKTAEFIEKYFRKGNKIAVVGHIQTGNYKNKDGNTVYTTEVIADRVEFVEKKADAGQADGTDNFVDIPDDIDKELPFT